MKEKNRNLGIYLKALDSLLVAFSGGVDSTFLLFRSIEEMGRDKVKAVIFNSQTLPQREFKSALNLATSLKIDLIQVKVNELENPEFIQNPKDRCYFCKSNFAVKLKEIAISKKIKNLADGTNFDDLADYRPGLKAARENNILSPLAEFKLTKAEIRQLARECHLPNWNKPSFACLSSRIPYGEKITEEKLSKIEKAEDFLFNSGFNQFRVRYHGDIARIEILPEEFEKLLELREGINLQFNNLGFKFVTLDIQGYKTGSLNI